MPDLALTRHTDGRVTIDGPIPERIAVAGAVLEVLDPASGGEMAIDGTLTIDGHRFLPIDYHHEIDVYEFVLEVPA